MRVSRAIDRLRTLFSNRGGIMQHDRAGRFAGGVFGGANRRTKSRAGLLIKIQRIGENSSQRYAKQANEAAFGWRIASLSNAVPHFGHYSHGVFLIHLVRTVESMCLAKVPNALLELLYWKMSNPFDESM